MKMSNRRMNMNKKRNGCGFHVGKMEMKMRM